jgi:hypothetical protein
VDNCLGKKTELRSPFKDAVRMTEATLLAVKATRKPPTPSSAANTATGSPRHPWHDPNSCSNPILNACTRNQGACGGLGGCLAGHQIWGGALVPSLP